MLICMAAECSFNLLVRNPTSVKDLYHAILVLYKYHIITSWHDKLLQCQE